MSNQARCTTPYIRCLAVSMLVVLGLCLRPLQAAEPIRLVVGYQPYDTLSYSAVVIRALGLWKKYLPPGSEVNFEEAPQGSIIVSRMLAGKEQIGYLGDMPAVVATTRRSSAPINLVASLGYSSGQRCGIVMVRADAPQFRSTEEAMQWLNGKVIAAPGGSCADRFLKNLTTKKLLQPGEVVSLSLDAISAQLQARKIDAAVVWEPTASRIGSLVGESIGRVVATGYSFGISDSGALAMREDFMKERPDIAEAWLRAELEAQRFMLNPKNQAKVAGFVRDQAPGITQRMAWFSIYGGIPSEFGGSVVRDEKRFVFDDNLRAFFNRLYQNLYSAGAIDVERPHAAAIDDSLARKVAAEAGVGLPLGLMQAQPLSAAPK